MKPEENMSFANQDINRRELLQKFASSLLGFTSVATVANLLTACDQGKHGGTHPRKNTEQDAANYFSPHQRQTIAVLSDIILPKTDTPGALDTGVPEFIESVVRDVFVREDQSKFNNGLFSFDLLCTRLHESNFIDLGAETRKKLAYNVNLANTKGNKLQSVLRDTSKLDAKTITSALNYFSLVKELTLFGFYTSEIGATQVLQYNPIPGRFDGCASLASIGKTWATPK